MQTNAKISSKFSGCASITSEGSHQKKINGKSCDFVLTDRIQSFLLKFSETKLILKICQICDKVRTNFQRAGGVPQSQLQIHQIYNNNKTKKNTITDGGRTAAHSKAISVWDGILLKKLVLQEHLALIKI